MKARVLASLAIVVIMIALATCSSGCFSVGSYGFESDGRGGYKEGGKKFYFDTISLPRTKPARHGPYADYPYGGHAYHPYDGYPYVYPQSPVVIRRKTTTTTTTTYECIDESCDGKH